MVSSSTSGLLRWAASSRWTLWNRASSAPSDRVSTSQSDIRVVSGNRVNVRGGPGTNFGVVGKLGAGDTVEVIEDNGAGWVRFRSVNGQETGWMADFLLSSG